MFWIILSRIKSNPADKSSSRAFDTISAQALEKLIPLVYGELHRLARRYMAGERPSHILQTSALVNEAYLRRVDVKNVNWQNRAHFFGVSAQLMRRILVDFARSRRSLKRGGETLTVSLEEGSIVSPGAGADVVALDDALKTLAAMDDWKLANAWLLRELSMDRANEA